MIRTYYTQVNLSKNYKLVSTDLKCFANWLDINKILLNFKKTEMILLYFKTKKTSGKVNIS